MWLMKVEGGGYPEQSIERGFAIKVDEKDAASIHHPNISSPWERVVETFVYHKG